MNMLSWLFYIADVIPSIGVLFGCIGVILLMIVSCWVIFNTIDNNKDKYGTDEKLIWFPKGWWVVGFFALFLIFCANIVPSSRTIYMIAASEMGEDAYSNFKGSEIYDALKKRIEQELKIPLSGGVTPED